MISNFKKSSRIKTLVSLTLIAAVAITGLTSCGSVTEKTSLNSDKKISTETLNTDNKTPVSDNNAQVKDTKKTVEIKTNTNQANATTKTATNTNVSGKVKLYEGIYFDDAVYKSVDHLLKEYYEIAISNVKDNSFDFTVYKMIDSEKKIKKVVFLTNTAAFTGDGTKAAFYGKNYTIHFTFPNYHHAYPAVTDMEVSGFKELEGKTFVNNAIPGHEFG